MYQGATSSGAVAVTSATAVCAVPCLLTSAVLFGGSGASTLIVYDNASAASGTIIHQSNAAIAGQDSVAFNFPIACKNGITVAVAGTAAKACLSFLPL